MTFEEVSGRYAELKDRFENGAISLPEFENSVRAMVAVAPDGKEWRLDPHSGTWVELGSEKPASRVIKTDPGTPETLLQFMAFMVKGLVKSLPRIILIGLAMSVLTWVAHTFIIAKMNDGLMYVQARSAINSVVHLQNTYFRGVNAFWGLLAFFVSSFFMRALSMGPHIWLKNIVQTPGHIKSSFIGSGDRAGGVLILGAFLALFFVSIYRNFMISWILLIGILLIMTAHFKSLEITVLKLGLSDVQKLIGNRFFRPGEEYHNIYLALLGMAGGFFLAGCLRTNFWITFAFSFVFLIAFILLQVAGVPRAVTFLALASGVLMLKDNTVLAWCEGGSLSRAGGSWIDWWGSNNADLVRQLGIVPAVSSFLGGALGSAAAAVLPDIPVMENNGGEGIPVDTFPVNPAELGGPGDNPYTEFSGGDGPADCSRYGLPNYWVNTANLNLVIRDTVFASRGLGPPVNLSMTFNSAFKAKSMFGWGWSFSYEWWLEEQGEGVVLHKGSGQEISYTGGTPGVPSELIPPAGTCDRLIYYGDYWLYLIKGRRLYYRFDRVPGTSLARLTSVNDYYGQAVQLSYHEGGHVRHILDASGRVIIFSYNSHNLCSSFNLPDGRQASFHYDGDGRLIRAVDLLGVNSDYEYDSDGSLTKIKVGRSGRTTSFTYGGRGDSKRIVSVVNANGYRTLYGMISMDPRQVRITGPGGKSTVYHSSDGLTEAVVDPSGQSVRFTYERGQPVAIQDQNGLVTVREYDRGGNLTAEINPVGHRLTFSYDTSGNLIRLTDPSGAYWSYRYDEKGNLVGATTPAGLNTKMVYDEKGQMVEVTGYDGVKLEFGHDRFGNMNRVTDPLGHNTIFVYDEHGYHKTSMADQLGNTTAFRFDANGRLLKNIYPDGSEKSFGYDCCYPILTTDENGGNITIERDAAGDIIRTFDQRGFATGMDYDADGNPVSFRDELGRTTGYGYDAAGRLSRVTGPLGQRQFFSYDPAGNLVYLQVEEERRTVFEYDLNHQLVSVTDPLGSKVSIERDSLGRVTMIQNARGARINLSYNPDGLLVSRRCEKEEPVFYSYNEGGKLQEVKDITGATSFSYDPLGRLNRIVYPGGMEMSYRYDAAGNIAGIIYPGGLTVDYTYDSRNRPVDVNWGGDYIRFRYDPVGNLLEEERSNGTVSTYAYDDAGRMLKMSHRNRDNLFIERNCLRDASGNILEEKGFQPAAPGPDGDFNFSCNRADQLSEGSFRFDADGNLLETAEGWSARYDAENRLAELFCGGSHNSYTYNGLGHRVQVTGEDGTTTYYYNRAGSLLFEKDKDHNIHCYLGCLGRPVASLGPEGESLFYHYDQNGNTLALTGKEGRVVAAYAYSPFGLRTHEGEAGRNPFTYSGCFGVMSGENLYFMMNRCYSPALGRFLQKDPLGVEGGVNQYAYAANNPLRYVDPEGFAVLETYAALKLLATVGKGLMAAGKVVAKVSTAYGLSYAGYTGADSLYATTQLDKYRQDMRSAWSEYRDGNFAFPQSEEDAYQRYLQAWNEYQNISDRAFGGPERVTNTLVETGLEHALVPDEIQVPFQIGKYATTRNSKCGFTESTSKHLRPNERLTPSQRDYYKTILGKR